MRESAPSISGRWHVIYVTIRIVEDEDKNLIENVRRLYSKESITIHSVVQTTKLGIYQPMQKSQTPNDQQCCQATWTQPTLANVCQSV